MLRAFVKSVPTSKSPVGFSCNRSQTLKSVLTNRLGLIKASRACPPTPSPALFGLFVALFCAY